MAPERVERPSRRTDAALWFGVLAPPVAMLTNLEASYALVDAACATRAHLPMHLVALTMLVVAAVAGVLAWREWRALGGGWPGDADGARTRARFMAALGVLSSAYFGTLIVWQWVPNLVLHPCQ
jgi:hypothetical protein